MHQTNLENFVNVLFKTKRKRKTSLSIKQNNDNNNNNKTKMSKREQYLHCSIVGILVPDTL